MNEALQKDILIREIRLLNEQLTRSGSGVLAGTDDLESLPLDELRSIKRDLRDMVRTLGGARD